MRTIETRAEELNELTGWEHATGFLPEFISNERLETHERETPENNSPSAYADVKDKLGYSIEI